MIAVEPEQSNCSVCERNLGVAGFSSRVALLKCAVGATQGFARLVSQDGDWAYRAEPQPAQQPESVEMRPLAEILDMHASNMPVDLLKCDIEGAEQALFASCETWIHRVNSIIVELHPPYSVSDLLADLKRADACFDIAALVDEKVCPVLFLRRSKGD
jgi:FkbM family methyltransferase